MVARTYSVFVLSSAGKELFLTVATRFSFLSLGGGPHFGSPPIENPFRSQFRRLTPERLSSLSLQTFFGFYPFFLAPVCIP